MLIAMVAIFIVCWLPLNVMNLLLEYREQQIGNWRFILLVFFVAHVVAMSSTVYNPFLYAWMNDAFRHQFQRVLPLCRFGGRTSSRPAQSTATAAAALTDMRTDMRTVETGGVGDRLTMFVDCGGIDGDVGVKVEPQ